MLYWIVSASRIYTTLSLQEFLKSVILRRTGRQRNDRFWPTVTVRGQRQQPTLPCDLSQCKCQLPDTVMCSRSG